MRFHKLLLPFERYHIPHPQKLDPERRALVEKLNNEILAGKYRFVKSKCLCGSEDFDIIATVDKCSVLLPTAMCRSCGLILTNPRFSDTFYRELYLSETFNRIYYASADLEHFVMEKFSPSTGLHILRAIEKERIVDENTSVLEIGAGAGWNLLPFMQKKAKVLGLDYNPQLVEMGKKFNVPVEQGDENSIQGEFDIIILNHVLEHMPQPVLSLLKITEHLKANGLVYIGVPYVLNFDLTTLSLPHIYYFTPLSLKYFASQANLIPVKIEFLGKRSFYGLFKKGFYHNQLLLKQNVQQTRKVIRRRYTWETLLLHKKIKSIDDVPGKIFFQTQD